jgi:eukaryotic-like serine/threonine-protein kinase
MSDAFWQEVETAFAAAVTLPAQGRPVWLDAHCTTTEVRKEVESLLFAHDQSGGFLVGEAATTATAGDAWSPQGQTIAGFRLLEPIGQGGMGVVYRAERVSGDFTQQVAFKLIDGRLRSADSMRRFRSERQILASLTHPNIVMLLDGGVTDHGEAYLVMEYVDGVRITDHCAAARLGLDRRLTLFRQVCAAVQHAHRHGVVHRDLKPGNIFVTPDGIPKVLDFGIAKVVDRTSTDVTAVGAGAALTPNYASPEQLRGLPVTTSSDVYSLGVLLYEVVAGTRPYETEGRTLDDVLALVGSDRTWRASDGAAASDETRPYAASRLRGDLDAVVAKAMNVEPDRRYASADELSADLGRYLAGEPVLAREPSFWYLAGRLARRHRIAVTASAAVLVAILAALSVSVYQTRVATRERDRAEQRFRDLRQLANALIFKIHDGVAPLPGSLEVRRTIVAEALTYLEKLSADSTADAQLRLELARGYHRVGAVQGRPNRPNLGDRPGAIHSLRKSVAILSSLVAESDPAPEWIRDLVEAEISLAETLVVDGARPEALKIIQDAVTRAEHLETREATDRNRGLLGNALFQLALTVDPPQRIETWTRAAPVYDALLAEQPTDRERQRNVALVYKYMGANYAEAGDAVTAHRHYVRALTLDQERLVAAPGNRSAQFDVAIDLANVANELAKTGRHAEAAENYEQSLVLRQSVVDQDPKDVQAQGRLAYVHSALAAEYVDLRATAKSVSHARAAVGISQGLVNLDTYHQAEHAANLQRLGYALWMSGDRPQACQAYQGSNVLVAKLRASDAEKQNARLGRVEQWLVSDLARCRKE